MIEYLNKHHSEKYFFKYSTPSDYIDALKQYNISWPTKYDDMFPYADRPTTYWTGFYTSRANDKDYVRRGSSNFHASSLLYSIKMLDQSASESKIQHILKSSYEMMNALGIYQHHDAITGTATQVVAYDYVSIL